MAQQQSAESVLCCGHITEVHPSRCHQESVMITMVIPLCEESRLNMWLRSCVWGVALCVVLSSVSLVSSCSYTVVSPVLYISQSVETLGCFMVFFGPVKEISSFLPSAETIVVNTEIKRQQRLNSQVQQHKNFHGPRLLQSYWTLGMSDINLFADIQYAEIVRTLFDINRYQYNVLKILFRFWLTTCSDLMSSSTVFVLVLHRSTLSCRGCRTSNRLFPSGYPSLYSESLHLLTLTLQWVPVWGARTCNGLRPRERVEYLLHIYTHTVCG